MLFKLTVISVLFFIHEVPQVQGGIGVTLSIFCGRPNPTWSVSSRSSDYKNIAKLLDSAYRKGYTYRSPRPKLGYKGFIVKKERRMVIYGSHTTVLQTMLLDTMPAGYLPQGNIDKVRSSIDRRTGRVRRTQSFRVSGNRGQAKRYVPPYNPAPWSANSYIERCNNCYNYANLRITNTTAQPGAGSGQEFATCTGREVQAAAIRDGLQLLDPQPAASVTVHADPDPNGTRHLVALVVDPDRDDYMGDFHWYLLDDDLYWSHKPGQTSVTREDNDGRGIRDPRQANTAPYHFVSFMTSDRYEVQIFDYEMFCD